MILYTAGHSVSSLGDFVALMKQHEIDVVADVRSKPRSRLPHFDQVPLQAALEDAGINYRFLGDRLGGVPQDPAVRARWQQGRLDPIIIAHLRSTDEWHDGLSELTRQITGGGGRNVCVMCSEADANECHRKAVALDAAEAVPGLEIRHLAANRTPPTEVGVQEVLL